MEVPDKILIKAKSWLFFGENSVKSSQSDIRHHDVISSQISEVDARYVLLEFCPLTTRETDEVPSFQAFHYPEHVGFPVGMNDSGGTVIVEIHYDNPEIIKSTERIKY